MPKTSLLSVGDEIDAVVKRMNADAAEAERKLQQLNQAGTQSFRDQDLLEAVEADLARNRARRPAAPFLSVGLAPPTKSEFRTTNARWTAAPKSVMFGSRDAGQAPLSTKCEGARQLSDPKRE